ncbi:MAG: aromatic ring-hydroxylating dioxygenase subunit alpha [Actinomycetia bacterium]|nr:aromatic ring-hydroxylating dioxygenase subunit alpha [Actinomycetes bacterium]
MKIPAHPDQKPPAKARATTYRARRAYGLVWVSLGQPGHDIPHFPKWGDESYRKILCGPYSFDAAGTRAVENFLDVVHFPFVHAGYLGDPQHPEIDDYEVQLSEEGIVAEGITVWQPDPDGSGKGARVTYTYRVLRPMTAYFTSTFEEPAFAAYFTVLPTDEVGCCAWMWLAMNYSQEQPEAVIREFEDAVTAQDIPIVESQRPELLPLDLPAELHLRSDRTAIAYRKWLQELGLVFGTV